MRRIPTLLMLIAAILAASLDVPLSADAQTAPQSGAKSKTPPSHIKPMHPSALSLYPHGRPKPRHSANSFTRHRFDHPTPIHNTFMGPRYY
jgi:hypothetical protein